jgi:hypothetical protein
MINKKQSMGFMMVAAVLLGLLRVPVQAGGQTPSPLATRAADLAGNFPSPPPSAKTGVFWFWVNGNITREGITADLEAMARVASGG